MLEAKAKEIYKKLKGAPSKFVEEKHCVMILQIMSNPKKSTYSAFCVEAEISENSFWNWLKEFPIFLECYAMGKMFARENWEAEGRRLKKVVSRIGESSYRFEYWRLTGWSRFGVGKNSRIRLDVDPNATPNKQYSQLLAQASKGDYTAGEIKQLMEAINVGLNAHQVFELQKEINQLKADLATMTENTINGDNTIPTAGFEKKD